MSSTPSSTFQVFPIPTQDDSLGNELLTEAEFAALMHRDIRTVRRWQSLRLGPPIIKLAKVRMYRREAVVAWLKSLEVAGADPRRKIKPRKRGSRR